MASRRKGRPGHELTVKWDGYMAMAGPPDREQAMRDALAEYLSGMLREACPVYFGRTTLPEIYGRTIADETRFIPAKRERTVIKSLNVSYRNRRDWRTWLRVRDGENDGTPGGSPARK